MGKGFFISLIMVLSSFSLADVGNRWIEISETEDDKLYIDSKSLKATRDKKIISYWLKANKGPCSDDLNKNSCDFLLEVEVDCEHSLVREITSVFTDLKGRHDKPIKSDDPFREVHPESGDEFLLAICSLKDTFEFNYNK